MAETGDEQNELDSSREKAFLTMDEILLLRFHNLSSEDVGAVVNEGDQPMANTTAFLS